MKATPTLRTDRLILRPWRDEDLPSFAAINADPRAMRHFPTALTREESDDLATRFRAHFETHGFGAWAVEVPGVTPFAGCVGLCRTPPYLPVEPTVEVLWRLAPAHWGRGFATEAARRSIRDGFARLGLSEIVSFTVPANRASVRVMERVGLRRVEGGDFDHPRVPSGDPLRRHLLYRARAEEWG